MTQQENRRAQRDAELKVAEKKRLIAEAQESFARHAIVATQPGEVTEALVTRGASVKAGEPVLKLKSSGIRAVFELPKADADKARQLGFCRAEIDGKPLECSLAAEGGDETHVAIELPNDPNLAGKTRAPGARPSGRRVRGAPVGAGQGRRERPPVRGQPQQPGRDAGGRGGRPRGQPARPSPRAWTWGTG